VRRREWDAVVRMRRLTGIKEEYSEKVSIGTNPDFGRKLFGRREVIWARLVSGGVGADGGG